MDFTLSEEQQQLYKSLVAFARDVVEPEAGARDKEGRFDRVVWDACGEVGLTGICISEEYGGGGAGALDTGLALEALAYGGHDAGLGLSMGAHLVIGSKPIDLHGTSEQKAKYLPKLASGEWIGAFGITEPDAGSDTASLTSRGVRDGDHWILNGTKTFITNGPVCDVFTVVVRTDPDASAGAGMTAFVLDADTPGLSVGPPDRKMGQRGAKTADVIFQDCRVPASAIIGGIAGRGFATAMKVLDRGRLHISAVCVGAAERLLNDALTFAMTRRQFGAPIAEFQLIQAMLADSRTELYAAKSMVTDAARRRDAGEAVSLEASCCKLFCSEMVGRIADRAVQIHGGAGYMSDYPVERFYRDVRLFRLYEGTSQIQQLVIARNMIRKHQDEL